MTEWDWIPVGLDMKRVKSVGFRGGVLRNGFNADDNGLGFPFHVFLKGMADHLEELILDHKNWALEAYCLDSSYSSADGPYDLRPALWSLGIRNLFLQLRKLELVGLNVPPVTPPWRPSLREMVNWCALTRLVLDSCHGSEKLLDELSKADNAGRFMGLTEFGFRYESPRPSMAPAIEKFLCSFSGLKILSVQLDGFTDMPDHEKVFSKHGNTLKVLVWEGRRWLAGTGDLTMGSPSFLQSLEAHCFNLEELSIALDVKVSHTSLCRWMSINNGEPFSALRLAKLTTLHIRRLPVQDRNSVDPLFVAAKFLDWGNRNRTAYPNIKLIAIGPLLLPRPPHSRQTCAHSHTGRACLPFLFGCDHPQE
jgi:hypothetical protein